MVTIFSKLQHVAEKAVDPDRFTTLEKARMMDAAAASPQISNAAPENARPPSDTVVGSVVVMLDKSYQNYLTQRARLEAELAAKQEALRQTNAIIASLEAAMTTLASDPALTTEESNIAAAPMDAKVGAAVGEAVAQDNPANVSLFSQLMTRGIAVEGEEEPGLNE